jgi:LPXTG-motif cell wall-anchored protein
MRLQTTLAGALVGAAALVGLLAGPAGAQTSGPNTSGGARATADSVASGTCVAVDDSVCSGSGLAVNDSTSSGAATARDGSTSSGCATAVDDSTASGAPCPRPTTATTRPHTTTPHGGGNVPKAGTAGATAGRTLALTGTSSAELAALAGLSLLTGGALVVLSRRRPQES